MVSPIFPQNKSGGVGCYGSEQITSTLLVEQLTGENLKKFDFVCENVSTLSYHRDVSVVADFGKNFINPAVFIFQQIEEVVQNLKRSVIFF